MKKICDNITFGKKNSIIFMHNKRQQKKNNDKNVDKIIRKTTTQITIPKEINQKW
jgi:hypothetical protein